MEEDMVSQNMAFHGLNKRHPTAFEALEEVGSTEAYEAFSSTREVLQLILLGSGRRFLVAIR